MTVALADIRLLSDLFPHMIEARNGSENIRFNVLFSCLHIHNTYPIYATCEQKIGIGSLVPGSVNAALVRVIRLVDSANTPV